MSPVHLFQKATGILSGQTNAFCGEDGEAKVSSCPWLKP